MVVICDSGPLMTLAKLGVLPKVFSIYPYLTISETVHHEVVTLGLSIGAEDAKEVDKLCQSGQIIVLPSGKIEDISLDMISELHSGEIETIKWPYNLPLITSSSMI